uniref:SJCHGC02861 protein n=1 Tax=Schistosoma japonicum TaxID=6182 RepID=Q5DEI9_SCHJA|nr:SJCHGC02861 protein [Schistosoma japonicum]
MIKSTLFIKFIVFFFLMVQCTLVENTVIKRQFTDYMPYETPKYTLIVTDNNGNQLQSIISFIEKLLQIYYQWKISEGYIYYTSSEPMNNYNMMINDYPENMGYQTPSTDEYTFDYSSNTNYPISYELESTSEFMDSTEGLPNYPQYW